MQNESFLGSTPSWTDILSRTNSGRRGQRQPSQPGGPITSPGIPEDQVTHLPPPPQTPPTPGPAIPPPRYEDMLNGWNDDGSGGFTSQYRGGGQRGPSTSPFGSYGNSGEQAANLWGGLSDYFGGGQAGDFFGGLGDMFGNYGDGGNRGGRGNDTTPPGSAGSGGGLIATGTPYLGRTNMSAADVEFWNMPADYQSAYFEKMALRSVGDYDRSEPQYDAQGNMIDPGGEVVTGPKTTAIRQLMSDMAQTARSQMLSGYMPKVSY